MRNIIGSCVLALTLLGCGSAAVPQSEPAKPANASASIGAMVNSIRAEKGLGKLTRNAKLDSAARAHAKDMAANKFMSHTGTDGSDLRKRVERTGYRWCMLAENLARGHQNNANAVKSWRVSAGHYRTMIKRKAKEYGTANVNGFRVLVVAAKRC